MPSHVASVAAIFVHAYSHPVAGSWSRSTNPGLHAPIAHCPPTHAGVAFGVTHTLPHAPQLFGSVCSIVGLHVIVPQRPFTQMGVPPVVGHTLPQLPQFLGSCCTFWSGS